jgi:hypothetical protein
VSKLVSTAEVLAEENLTKLTVSEKESSLKKILDTEAKTRIMVT